MRSVLLNAPTAYVFEVHDPCELLSRDAFRIVNKALGVGHRHHLRAELNALLGGVLRYVARTADDHRLALQVLAARGEHLLRKVHRAVSCGFRADEAAAPVDALAREDAGELIPQTLVLAKHVPNLPSAHTDVAGWNVRVRSDVAGELGHEGLAKAHHLIVTLSLRIEVRTAFAAAHRQRRQGILENLLKAEEFQHAEVHR